MTLETFDKIFGQYATAYRLINDVFAQIAAAHPTGSEELEVAIPMTNAQVRFQEAEHWVRDLRAVLRNKTDEVQKLAEQRAIDFQKAVDAAAKEKADGKDA